MKKSLLLPALALTACVFGAVKADAQTQAFSDKVGYYTFDVEQGSNLIVAGLVRAKEFQGLLNGSSGSTLTLSSGTLTANAYNANGDQPTAFVEIVEAGHPSLGQVIDISTNGTTTVSVMASPAELAALGVVGTEAICIRKHVTMATLFESATNVAEGGADSITVFDSSGNAKNLIKLPGLGWWNTATNSSAGDLPIYPGQGVLYVANGSKSLRVGGAQVSHVKETPTRVSIYAGAINLVGQVNPLNGEQGTMGDLNLEPFLADGGVDTVTLFDNPAPGNDFKQIAQYIDLPGLGLWNTTTNQSGASDPIDFTEAILITPGAAGGDKVLTLDSGINPGP